MAFTAEELANIANGALDFYMHKKKAFVQNVQSKPMLAAFDGASRSQLSGGKGRISLAVMAGQGGLSLQGYSHDDQVSYGNPTPLKRVNYPWFEHFIGMGLTHTELKHDGITVTESGADQSNSDKDGREEHALNDLLATKMQVMAEDYAAEWDGLIHGDGSGDAKSLAGIRAFILDNPALGSLGGLNRTTNVWWRNRAATAAADSAGTGFAPITSSATGGGALINFLERERMQIRRYAKGAVRHKCFAGSDFIRAGKEEERANGYYSQTGVSGGGDRVAFNSEDSWSFGSWKFQYDPTLDDLGYSKRAYIIDMAKLHLDYMKGENKKKVNPARPHDRFVQYTGLSTTAGMTAEQLNTSAVYDIA